MAGGLVTSISAFLSARTNGRKVNVSPDDPLPVAVVSGGGGSSTSLADSSVVDAAGVYWLVRDNGTTLTYLNWATGATGTPTSPVTPIGKGTGRSVSTTSYTGVVAGTGYSVGDILQRIVVLDISTTTPTVIAAAWINTTTGLVMGTAPTMANLNPIDDNVAATIADGASATLGAKADAAATDSTSAWSGIALLKSMRSLLAGTLTTAGNVASGAADAGNPVKVGGRYNAALPVYADGQRTDMQTDILGNVRARMIARLAAGADNIPNTTVSWPTTHNGPDITSGPFAIGNFVFNGASWDRQRGDTNGSWAQGNVAAGGTDAGNPVKVGGVFNNTQPTLTTGQRGDFQVSSRGELLATISSGGVSVAIGQGSADALSTTTQNLAVLARTAVFNGTTWDRMRGDTNGAWAQGNVADAATDSGNPLKWGVIVNGGSLGTYATGQRANVPGTTAGSPIVTMGGIQFGGAADGAANNNILAPVSTTGGASAITARSGLLVAPIVFNGTSWDRAKKPNAVSRITSSASTTNATVAKASMGDLFAITGYNTTAAVVYLKIYNKASAPTVGTDTPVLTIAIPPNAPVPANCMGTGPLYFSTGIAYALTGAAADSDTTAVTAGAIVGLNLIYQ